MLFYASRANLVFQESRKHEHQLSNTVAVGPKKPDFNLIQCPDNRSKRISLAETPIESRVFTHRERHGTGKWAPLEFKNEQIGQARTVYGI
jgi:hypothetical protein